MKNDKEVVLSAVLQNTSNEMIKNFVTPMKSTALLLCSGATEGSATMLRTIGDILTKSNTEPLVIELRNDITTPFWEVALQYNHTVSSTAHSGLGGGLTSPAEYEIVKDIVQKETYSRYVLMTVDCHSFGHRIHLIRKM